MHFFSSKNLSALISAPLNQKFVCKDKLNITLRNPKYANIVLEFLPEIDIQPMNTASGFGSNGSHILYYIVIYLIIIIVYICDRTRRRTLRDSFQSRMTIFSGIVLGICSVSVLIGHSMRRHLKLISSNFGKSFSALSSSTIPNKEVYDQL